MIIEDAKKVVKIQLRRKIICKRNININVKFALVSDVKKFHECFCACFAQFSNEIKNGKALTQTR